MGDNLKGEKKCLCTEEKNKESVPGEGPLSSITDLSKGKSDFLKEIMS